MRNYQAVQLSITSLAENDVFTGSEEGVYEGVSDLNPNDRPDWFEK